jgi:phosphoglucomutase
MIAGFSYMNALTVIQTSQGLATYLITKYPEIVESGVVIGHDARHNSSRFAALASNAFTAKGIRVWWYANLSPTPLVAFGVNLFRAGAGIMITASHVSKPH